MLTPSERQAHFDTYAALAAARGGAAIEASLPFTDAQVAAALAAGDEHLNTLPLHKWDRAAGHDGKRQTLPLQPRYAAPWARGLSLAGAVCLLKHVARERVKRLGLLVRDIEAIHESY